MSPRRAYHLGKRAAAIEETRRRILLAAAEAYREHGIRGTSMQEVARRADVAAGTVLYHFPDAESLVGQVIAHLIETLDLPSTDIFAGVNGMEARVARLVCAVYDFYNRTDAWSQMFFRERDHVPALAEGEAKVMAAIGELTTSALGRFARDTSARAVVGAALDPSFCFALRRNGLSAEHAIAAATELITRWLDGAPGPSKRRTRGRPMVRG